MTGARWTFVRFMLFHRPRAFTRREPRTPGASLYSCDGRESEPEDFFDFQSDLKMEGSLAQRLSPNIRRIQTIFFRSQGQRMMAEALLRQTLAELMIHQEGHLSEENSLVGRAEEIAKIGLDQGFGVRELCEALRVGRTTLHKRFSEERGFGPGTMIHRLRMNKAIDLLQCTNYTIQEVTHRVGLKSVDSFSKQFKKETGESPLSFRQQHLGDGSL